MYTTNSKNTTRRRADLGGFPTLWNVNLTTKKTLQGRGFRVRCFQKTIMAVIENKMAVQIAAEKIPKMLRLALSFFARGEHEELIGLEEGACRFDLPVQSMSQTGVRHAHVDPPDCHVVDQVVVRPVPHVLQEIVAAVAQVLHLDVHLLGYGVKEFDRVSWVAAVEPGTLPRS
jgi:hypothetical protein